MNLTPYESQFLPYRHLQSVRRECLTVAVRVIARHQRSSQQTVRQQVKTAENALAVLDRIGQNDLATDLRFAIARASAPVHTTIIEQMHRNDACK